MGHGPDDALTARLQDTLRIFHDLREAAALSNSPSQSSTKIMDSSVLIDTVNLPSPLPLLPALLEAGISSEIASAISQVYQRRAEQLKQLIQEVVTTACRSAAEFPVRTSALGPRLFMESVASISTGMYLSRLREWKEEYIQRTSQASEIPAKAASRNPRTFNQEYVPLLEYFFEENPFPTHADKMFLAKMSDMKYKQIHVWFQNHRNRTKKEGKKTRKRPTCKVPAKPLGKLYERMCNHMVDFKFQAPESSQPKGTTEIKVAQNNVLVEAFAASSPTHAFPSPYPPTCHYDPFPCKTGPICFSEPEWGRVPNGEQPVPLSTTIDDLIERFSHLSVRDGTRSMRLPKSQSHAATIAITVIPPRAPHPSLIACQYSQPTNIMQLRPSAGASISCSKVFRSPTPTSKPVMLVCISAAPKSELPGKRTTIPLPRCLPGQARRTRRDTTPSESYSTSSSLHLFSTDTRDRSCSFSSASSLSMPQSNTGNIQAPSHSFGSPYFSPLDTPIHPCGLGGVASISPSSVL